jgi:prepilin-type N-terminal cleavage/methylation domain-containing protein
MRCWWLNHRIRRRPKSRRRSFSLLEMMVVLAIVALSAPLMGVGIYRGLKRERFEASVRELATQLGLAQRTMLYRDSDVMVQLTPGPKGLVCRLIASPALGTGTPIGPDRLLPGIEKLIWNGQQVEGALQLQFYSGGRLMPQGELQLVRASEVRRVQLAGYPHAIGVDTQPAYKEDVDAAYPQEVVSALSPH